MKQGQVSRKFIVASLGTLCAISSVAGAVSWPRVTSIMSVRKELMKQAKEFDDASEAAESVRTYVSQEAEEVKAQQQEYDAKLPASEALPELLAEVKRAGKAASIADLAISTQQTEQFEDADRNTVEGLDGQLFRQPLVLSGRADYRSIAMLMDALLKGRRLVLVRELMMERAEGGRGLSFRAEADAYCFLKPKESK